MAQQVRGDPAHPNGSRVWGELGAGAGGWLRCSTCSLIPASPSHGEDAAAVYRGAAVGGNLAAAALAGLLTEQPCKRRGGASGSASPVCRTWEPLSIFFSSCICTSVCIGLLGETPSP